MTFPLLPPPVKSPKLGFVLGFIFTATLAYALLNMAPDSFYAGINRVNALAAGWMLQTLGIDAVINGDLISCPGFTAKVVGECSAVFISVLPLAFFLSYPAPVVLRAAGVLMGLPLLFGINILRIALVIMAGRTWPDLFAWIHLYLGQIGMILVVVWICMIWLQWISRQDRDETTGRSAGRFVLLALVFSTIPFAAWIWLSRPYTRVVLYLGQALLKLGGVQVVLPDTLGIYPHLFISFNIVILFSMVLADQLILKKLNFKQVALGFGALMGLHILFQVLPLLFFQYRFGAAQYLINALLIVHQFVLPFVLWLMLMPMVKKAEG